MDTWIGHGIDRCTFLSISRFFRLLLLLLLFLTVYLAPMSDNPSRCSPWLLHRSIGFRRGILFCSVLERHRPRPRYTLRTFTPIILGQIKS